MASPRFPATVDEEGRILPVHRERVGRFAGKGQTVWVSVHERPMSIRGMGANRLLWHIYGCIAAETGNDPDTVHQALKREAVRVGILEPQYVLMGDQLFEGEPTTVVEQEAFSRYIDWLKDGCRHGKLVGMVVDLGDIE